MSKTRKILLAILSAIMAFSMLFAVACAKEEPIVIKTVPPVVQHRVGESINLYDYIVRESGVTYKFAMAYEDEEPKQLAANGYLLEKVGNYTMSVTATKGGSTASTTMSFSVIEVAPTLWSNEVTLSSSWLSYTLLYKLLDEAGPFAMPIDGVDMELTHAFVYPAEDDSYGYKIDLTGTKSYIEEFKTAKPDVLTPIELTEDNVDELGFYVKRRKLKTDTSAIKASDGKYYGEKDMQGLFMFLIEGKYEFHYRAYNGGGEKTSKFFVTCTEKLTDLVEIEDGLTFDRKTFIATWKPVEGAVKYKVKLLNKNYFIEDTSFDCSEIIKNRIMDFTLVVLPIGETQEALNDYVNDSKMTYVTPYFGSEGTTLNEDESITIKGVNPPGELYLNIASVENDYYALRGDFGIGSFIDITFKGNNMPSVLFFADEINGQLSYQGGRGIAVVNGLHASVEGAKEYPGSTNVYGPNRMNTHYSYSPLGRLPAEFSQKNAIAREEANPGQTYKYTIGTRLDNAGSLVVVSSLANLDTGKIITTSETRLWYWYDATRNPKTLTNPRYLDATDVEAGDIILYAPWKDNAEDCTFLSVSDPYYIDPNPVLYNDDGSVSLYSQIPAGSLYGSFNGTSNSYVAHEGSYGVGTFVDFEFTGNNMPSVMFFADEINSIMGFQGGKGIIGVSGILTREYLDNPYHEIDNPSGIKPTNGSVKIFGPNRVNMHYTYADLANYGGEFAGSSLMNNPDRNYKYTVGTRIDDEGYLRWVAELYDTDTGKMIGNADLRLSHKFDMEIPDDKTTPETEWNIEDRYLTADDVKAGSIVAYAQFKGTTEERTTFKMSEPYTRDTTISKANAIENKDGSFTLHGAETTLLWSGPNAATGSIGYVAHNGKYDVGSFVEYTFKGNNMPQVLLFANNMNGNMSGNGGGKGILLLNGIKNSSGGDIKNFQIYGPNRMSGHFPGYAGYRNSTETFALNQNSLINAGENVEYRYVVGTKVVYEDVNLMTPVDGNWAGKDGYLDAVVYVVAELYNKETNELLGSINTPLRANYNAFDKTTVNKYLTVDDVEAGHIVAFATLKGLNDDGTVATTTFTCSKKPYTLTDDSTAHKHSFTKMDKNETVHWLVCADETCGAKFNPVAHTGGEATCTERAVCEVCSGSYGELKPHVGGTATCYEAATCDVCGNKYGTFGHDYTTAVEGSIVVDGEYHKYHCGKCDTDTEKELHFGGEATFEKLSECVVCGAEYGDYLPPATNDQVILDNIKDTKSVEFKGKRTLTNESGALTFTGTIAEPIWSGGTPSITLNKQYTNEFIKVGLTALTDYTSNNLPSALGISIGFRRTTAGTTISEWVFTPVPTNGFIYLYYTGSNALGNTSYVIDKAGWANIKEGNQYYIVVGVTGTDSTGATETTEDDVNLHWALLDGNNQVMRYIVVSQADLISKFTGDALGAKKKVLNDSGFFTIHNTAAGERTISYEILSADKVLYELNGSKPVEITGVERNKITWKAMENASSYAVKVDDGTWTNVGNVTSYEIPNLVEGTEYTAQVKAVFSDFDSNAGSLTFTYSSHLHAFDELKTDATYHWYVCDCGQETEKVEHNGGEATTALQAKCTGCNIGYGNTVVPENITLINANTFIAHDGVAPSLEGGKITFTNDLETIGDQATSAFSLNKAYTDEFIKIGFTALDGDGTAVNLYKAMGFEVGFRRNKTAEQNPILNDWMFVARNDTNYGYFYNKAANAFALGAFASKLGTVGNLKLVKGNQYYFVLGVTGKAPTAGQTDNRTVYAMWLDADSKLIGGFYANMPQMLAKKPNMVMTDSGYFSIHSYVKELTISYEILTAAERCELLGIHDFDNYTFVDDTYHAQTCDCGESKGNVAHTGGEATYTEKAVCAYCKQSYGTLKQSISSDVKLINMTNVTATPSTGKEVIDTTSGTIKFTPSQAAPSHTDASVIVLKKQFTTEFIKVGFTALEDYTRNGSTTNLNSVLGISVEYRTSSETSVGGYDQWGINVRNDTNYFTLYSMASGHYYAYPSTRTVAKALVAGEQYYILAGITESSGENTLYFYILDENNTVMAKAVATQANITQAATNRTDASKVNPLPTSGYFTINSWATTEREISYEIISAEDALAIIG